MNSNARTKNTILESLQKKSGKLRIVSNYNAKLKKEYKYLMSPGVAIVSKQIKKDGLQAAKKYTIKQQAVGFITDGSAILSLGNLGPLASISIVEGKAAVFSSFTGMTGIPLSLASQALREITKTITNISPILGSIHLEDIAAPKCFEIVKKLQDLGIPVYHDDQHGVAMAVYAAAYNVAKSLGKEFSSLKVVINGSGAAGIGVARMLLGLNTSLRRHNLGYPTIKNLTMLDSKGILCKGRESMNPYKRKLAAITNSEVCGDLGDALDGADLFIGVSTKNVLKPGHIKKMAKDPAIFALANPIPEISDERAKKAGAKIYFSGRGGENNSINTICVYPFLHQALLKTGIRQLTEEVCYEAALALAEVAEKQGRISPDVFQKKYGPTITSKLIERFKKI